MNATVVEPPLASEQALLGGCILDPDRITEVSSIVAGEDFYRPDHGRLWMLLRDMRAAGDVVDLVTVTEAVLRGGHADQYGGLTYVLSLTERVSSTANLSHYARIVADGHQRRRLEREAAAVAQAAREGVPLGSLRAALALLSEAPGGEGADDWVTYAEATATALDEMEAAEKRGGAAGSPVPWAALREILPAIPTGEMTVIGARPSQGKSALARGLAECCADGGDAVLVFSLEMRPSQMATNTICSTAEVDTIDALRGRMDQRAWDKIEATREGVASLPIFIARASNATIEDIIARATAKIRLLKRQGITVGLIVVDYLQLVTPSQADAGKNESVFVGKVTRALKNLATAEQVAVVALSQLNRKATGPDGRDIEPNTAHLKDSGSIEADAGVIIFVHRPNRGLPDFPDNVALIRVAKARYGRPGDVTLKWDGPAVTFRDEDWTALQRMVD